MYQALLTPQFARPITALWASNLLRGHIANHQPFIEHFKNSRYQLLHYSAAHLYPWVINSIAANPGSFRILPPSIRNAPANIANHLEAISDNSIHESIIEEAAHIELGDCAKRLDLLFCNAPNASTSFPQEGVPFIRDVRFIGGHPKEYWIVDKRSPMTQIVSSPEVNLIREDIACANGTFWIGSNYTLMGISEFVSNNGFAAPDELAMKRTEGTLNRIFQNYADYPIIWVRPEYPVSYRGHDYYFPLSGHLDDFICPLYEETGKEVYLFAELDSNYYCGSRQADSEVIVNLQRPLLQKTAEALAKQLELRGKKLELIYLPVLWDDAGIYAYVNCITERFETMITLHMPRFLSQGHQKFNTISEACEQEIRNRLSKHQTIQLIPSFIDGFNFTENIRANKGGIHCMVNATP